MAATALISVHASKGESFSNGMPTKWSTHHTESKPASSAAWATSRAWFQLVPNCGRQTPKWGRVDMEADTGAKRGLVSTEPGGLRAERLHSAPGAYRSLSHLPAGDVVGAEPVSALLLRPLPDRRPGRLGGRALSHPRRPGTPGGNPGARRRGARQALARADPPDGHHRPARRARSERRDRALRRHRGTGRDRAAHARP